MASIELYSMWQLMYLRIWSICAGREFTTLNESDGTVSVSADCYAHGKPILHQSEHTQVPLDVCVSCEAGSTVMCGWEGERVWAVYCWLDVQQDVCVSCEEGSTVMCGLTGGDSVSSLLLIGRTARCLCELWSRQYSDVWADRGRVWEQFIVDWTYSEMFVWAVKQAVQRCVGWQGETVWAVYCWLDVQRDVCVSCEAGSTVMCGLIGETVWAVYCWLDVQGDVCVSCEAGSTVMCGLIGETVWAVYCWLDVQRDVCVGCEAGSTVMCGLTGRDCVSSLLLIGCTARCLCELWSRQYSDVWADRGRLCEQFTVDWTYSEMFVWAVKQAVQWCVGW